MPAKGVDLAPGQTLQATTRFHFPRQQLVRVMLASNGAGQVTFDGREILSYDQAHFVPAPHRPDKGTTADLVVDPGWHRVQVTLTFATKDANALILFADGYDHQLICNLTPSLGG